MLSWANFSLSNFPLLTLLVKKEKKNQNIKINKIKSHLKYNNKNFPTDNEIYILKSSYSKAIKGP